MSSLIVVFHLLFLFQFLLAKSSIAFLHFQPTTPRYHHHSRRHRRPSLVSSASNTKTSSSSTTDDDTAILTATSLRRIPGRPTRIVVKHVSHKYPKTLMHKLFSSMPQREYAVQNITFSAGHHHSSMATNDDHDHGIGDHDGSSADDDDHGVILLVGRSGSGKSTLLRLLSGIECPNDDDDDDDGGCILVNGQTIITNESIDTTKRTPGEKTSSSSGRMAMKNNKMAGIPSWVKMGTILSPTPPQPGSGEELFRLVQPVILVGKPDFDDTLSVMERIVQVGEDAVRRFEKYAGWKQPAMISTNMINLLAEDIASLVTLTEEQVSGRPSKLSPSGEYLFGIACGCMMSMAPSIVYLASSYTSNTCIDEENEDDVGVHYPILLLDELFDTEHPSIVGSCARGMLNLIQAGGVIMSATHRPAYFHGMSTRTITISSGKMVK